MKGLFLFLVAALFCTISCSQGPNQFQYHPPLDLGDGLKVGMLDEVGIDTLLIGRGITRITKGKYGEIHSVLIYKNGKLVLEEYFPGHQFQWDGPRHYGEWLAWDEHMLHRAHSVTKSVTSACIGIAVDKGYIENVNQSIFDYLPDHQQFRSEGREKITIEHLLTMTSGLPWYEWGAPYSSEKNPIIGVWFSDKDPVSFTLDATLDYPPGTHYIYYGGSQVLLGEILRHATGSDIDEFSREHLFTPLGIDSANWAVRYEDGVIEAAGGLELTPRSLLKIGILFLNEGRWNGQQLISAEWVKQSATNYRDFSIDVPGTDNRDCGYGYSWWIPTFEVEGVEIAGYSASGWGGQKIVVIPALESVVVFNGGNYTRKTRLHSILENYIVPALSQPVVANSQ